MTNPADAKFYDARIVERKDFTEDLWSVRVEVGGPFSFRAGQYATLGVVTPEEHIERAYSIVSAPEESPLIEFFIERVEGGELTPKLYKLHVGDTFTCRKSAKGRFTLESDGGRRNHLLLCTVTGVAPYVGYIRNLINGANTVAVEGDHKLFLIEGASHSTEFAYDKEIEAAAKQVPWLTYVPTVSRPWNEPEWKGEVGRVDDLIRKYTDLWQLTPNDTAVYLCGHPEMVERGKGILTRRGWQKEAMKEEKFFVPED